VQVSDLVQAITASQLAKAITTEFPTPTDTTTEALAITRPSNVTTTAAPLVSLNITMTADYQSHESFVPMAQSTNNTAAITSESHTTTDLELSTNLHLSQSTNQLDVTSYSSSKSASTVCETRQPIAMTTTNAQLATATTNKSEIQQTTQKRKTVTTTPAPDAPPPTNAPLTGSNIPGRTALNHQTQAAQHLTQTLANMSLTEKQHLGYQAADFLLDCQYAGYSCNPRSDFAAFYNNIHGNCYVFNSGWNKSLPILNVSSTGSKFG
jgi:uncharacterized protein YueI